MRSLLRFVPTRLSTPLARHAIPIVVGTIGVLLLVAIAATALVSPGTLGVNAARITDEKPLDDIVAGLEERDGDNDGLSDSLENYVYGTDPENWDSAGVGIPDGWLVQYGYDPLDPLTKSARGRAPPATSLPTAYADGYPLAYTPPLKTYYEYAKPAGYQPGVDAPWWRSGAEHADPVAPDQTGTGIPTGWIIVHNLTLRDFAPDRVATGSTGNLTILEAWEHDTDPLLADSDRDGLDDWVEIHSTLTDPSKFSSVGGDIADGWLVRFGLRTDDPDISTHDPDRDGLTNSEEFRISVQTYGAEGLKAVMAKGLDPLNWETAGTGIPDGWYVRYGLSPFGADVERLIGKASDFPEYRTYAPEGSPVLDDIVFTVRGAYEYARPDDWNESTKGVWWGGTNPVTLDSDSDGLPDPVEIRGWYANVTFDTGPEAKPRLYVATSNPLEPDSDGDGLDDLEEYRGRVLCSAGAERTFPPTDPRNRDTAFSGLSDHEKVCGVVRGDAKYDISAGLDPTKADSASDHLKDGARVDHWHKQYEAYRQNPRYAFNGSEYRTVFEWTEKYARFAPLTRDQVLAQFRPDGDVDNDGIVNVADADPSGGLFLDKFGDPGALRTKVYFLGGPEIDPAVYRLTEFASPVPHSATDPANPDTDGDGLPDAWEIRYGRFDPARSAWDLDPSKRDSDGDGVTDDKANNDNDVVTWYSFEERGTSPAERTSHTFVFNNQMEFLAGTDPNEVSSAGDGVPDGWKAFWGSRVSSATYPNLIAARDASIGSIALAKASEIDAAIAQSGISTTSNLKGLGGKATGYVRLINVSACGSDVTTLLKPGERVAEINPCLAVTSLDNVPVKATRVYGVKKVTYADEARLRTNPYMTDTDGDGAPDAFEAYYLVRTPSGNAYPDPVVDDGAKDSDNDGLGVEGECRSSDGRQCGFETFKADDIDYGAGADPNSGDTDFDGIEDGIESDANINPLDPSDVVSFASGDLDFDADGVPDFLELTGKDAKTYFGEPIRTNPKDPDTDGDGLIDGETRNLNPANPAHAALIASWNARGIAHRSISNGTFDYLGERTFGPAFGVRPDKLDSAIADVPDGWLAYYNQNPKERTVSPAPYEAFRPAWWNEHAHGVWWWGNAPGVAAVCGATPDDADCDGLHDLTGEDPFPASNRLNVIADANTTIRDPALVEAYVKAVAGVENQRVRAQRYGDGAGDPAAARASAATLVDPATNVYLRDMRACVAILDVVAPSVVNKGEAFNVTGRVVLNERSSGVCGTGSGALLEGSDTARVGLPNRAVLVSVFTPERSRVIGGGFTDANGRFNLSANITTESRIPIPVAGTPLLGSVAGVAFTDFDPTVLAAGARTGSETNRLVVWVYNTTSTANASHPQHATHSARLADKNGLVGTFSVSATKFAVAPAVPITVKSTTRLVFEAPDSAVNGARLTGEVRLLDASGGPLTDRPVILKWTGSTSPIEFRNLSTDRTGRINITTLGIPVGVRSADDHALSANFTSVDPNLLASEATLTIRVRHPTNISAATDRSSITVGEAVAIEGTLDRLPVPLPDGSLLAGTPVMEGAVVAAIGGVEETAKTDANGRFTLRVPIPGSVSAGRQTIRLTFAGSDDEAGATRSLPLDVKRTAEIVDLNRLEGPRSIEVTLRGRLVDNEGIGFGGPIEVHSDTAGMLARGLANNEGDFGLVVPLSALKLGSQPLRIAFPGDVGHAPASNITLARITSVTRVELTEIPAVLVRGDPVPVAVRLVDDKDAPVASQPITVYWRGDKVEVRVTDGDGRVSFLVPTNLTERPSLASVGVEFSPAANAVYQPATAAREVRVVAGVVLTLAEKSVARGPVAIGGKLVDDEARPLPGSAITIALDGSPIGEARVARNGTFELQHVLPDATALGPHRVSVHFAGGVTLANTTTNATWSVRSPLVVELTQLSDLVRGERATIDGVVRDDRGALVNTAFHVLLAGRDLGEVRTSNGKIETQFTVPPELERGATTLRLLAPESAKYDAYVLDLPVIVKIRPKVDVELPTVAVRGFAVGGAVTLTDDRGQPLRNTSYAYVIGAGGAAVTGQTNAEGKGSVAGVAPISGSPDLLLTVRGGSDVVAAQFTAKDMRVVGPATPIGYAALVIAILIVLLVVALIVAAIILRRRQLQEAREIVDEAIRDLLAGNEYAGTIFLAYRRFAAYLARHGFAEKASDTPREFALGVRKALPIGATPLRSLIGLFEEARYSDHPIGSPERDAAVKALRDVRGELDGMLGARAAEQKVSA